VGARRATLARPPLRSGRNVLCGTLQFESVHRARVEPPAAGPSLLCRFAATIGSVPAGKIEAAGGENGRLCATSSFVGYQFGESALISSGYYRPEVVHLRDDRGRRRRYESYYFGSVADATWRGGRTEAVYRLPGTERTILATDVNRWRGTFTGKHGIFTLADFKDPARQELAMRDHLRANHALLARTFSRHRPAVRSLCCTWSGLLAAAHLCGPHAAAAFALTAKSAADGFETRIETYFTEFNGFETPYDA
jgi:hypothetical protein